MRYLTLPIVVLALIGVTAATSQKRSTSLVIPSRRAQWEYGIYQVNQSKYIYEWLYNDGHIHAPNKQAFFEKLGIANALVKTNQKYIETSRPFPDYIIDVIVLNHLGEQGWEFVESSERIFRLKRRKIQ